MNKRNPEHKGGLRSLKTLLLFCTVVFVVICVSIFIKVFAIWRNNTFDSSRAFITEVQVGKKIEFISFSPKVKKISILLVGGDTRNASKVVGVPVDGKISHSKFLTNSKTISSTFFFFFLHPPKETNMTIFDLLRLSLLAHSVTSADTTVDEVSLPLAKALIDRVIADTFVDSQITTENKNIEIINASDIGGAGGQMEQMLVHLGATVVSVRTAQKQQDKTTLRYTGERGYTLRRLERLLDLTSGEANESQIADIQIVLGKDFPALESLK